MRCKFDSTKNPAHRNKRQGGAGTHNKNAHSPGWLGLTSLMSGCLSFSNLFAEKSLQRQIHFLLILNHIMHELLLLQVAVGGHQGAAAVVLVHLAVAEHVAALQQLADQLDAALIVGGQIVAIREMEGIDVVFGRRIAAVDNLQCFLIRRGADRPPALPRVKKSCSLTSLASV